MKARGAIILALLLCPGIAIAAGGEEVPVREQIAHALNLALLIGIVVYFARKPARDHLKSRRATIVSDLERAQNELASAEAKLADWDERMTHLDDELDAIRRSVRDQAETERDRILADAEASAHRIRGNATAAVEQETRRARGALRAETAEIALAKASTLIGSRIEAGDRDRLVDEFLRDLDRAPGQSEGPS